MAGETTGVSGGSQLQRQAPPPPGSAPSGSPGPAGAAGSLSAQPPPTPQQRADARKAADKERGELASRDSNTRALAIDRIIGAAGNSRAAWDAIRQGRTPAQVRELENDYRTLTHQRVIEQMGKSLERMNPRPNIPAQGAFRTP